MAIAQIASNEAIFRQKGLELEKILFRENVRMREPRSPTGHSYRFDPLPHYMGSASFAALKIDGIKRLAGNLAPGPGAPQKKPGEAARAVPLRFTPRRFKGFSSDPSMNAAAAGRKARITARSLPRDPPVERLPAGRNWGRLRRERA